MINNVFDGSCGRTHKTRECMNLVVKLLINFRDFNFQYPDKKIYTAFSENASPLFEVLHMPCFDRSPSNIFGVT